MKPSQFTYFKLTFAVKIFHLIIFLEVEVFSDGNCPKKKPFKKVSINELSFCFQGSKRVVMQSSTENGLAGINGNRFGEKLINHTKTN